MPAMRIHPAAVPFIFLFIFNISTSPASAQSTLENQLSIHPVSYLAKRARIMGNWENGAQIFSQAGMGCTQCHSPAEGVLRLGPDLTALGERAKYEHVVNSILDPSQKMEDGYRTVKLLTVDGVSLTGILREEQPERIVLAIPGEERPRTISRDDIEVVAPSDSLMPKGLVNQLQDEQQFFDLVRFVVELGATGSGGTAAKSLTDKAQLAAFELPAYESDLDHRGLIAGWDKPSLRRGEELYAGLCVNCHGTKNKPGSLPNALPFASGKFRNGADPYSMYRTVTLGYRMMLPQHQLTPQQKYDVIHYIRENYLKKFNPSQYAPIEESYLASLPRGTQLGPAPSEDLPWRDMNYGPFLISTYEMTPRGLPEKSDPSETNIAFKGVAVRLDAGEGGISQGSRWAAFDHDTMRIAGVWNGSGFIDWHGILFDGRHGVHPHTIGEMQFGAPNVPGWANPEAGTFEDARIIGKDGRPYGPLPRSWAHYKGLYRHGDRVVISYSIGDAAILESHAIASPAETDDGDTILARTLNVGKSSHGLTMRLAPSNQIDAAIIGPKSLALTERDGYLVVHIPAEATPVQFKVLIAAKDAAKLTDLEVEPAEDLAELTHGGPAMWAESLEVKVEPRSEFDGFAVDILTRPTTNRWNCRLQLSGLDFLPDNRMVVCTCGGDVWTVENFDSDSSTTWRRIASGLFQPLGIKVVDGSIFVGCRDQIVRLHDLNEDGEIDFFESFNSDHQVTEHFHEFAMGLQVDDAGNFYYAKSARHAKDSLVPHHGTLLKVSADGSETQIVANGFRAANGVCLNPDGSFFVTDQEGHWTPMNRINRVIKGGFYGNMYSYGAPADSSDQAMEAPVCWPNKSFDRSPAELLWLTDKRWGPLSGSLLSLSYGYGRIFVVPHEKVGPYWQGGMCRLPIPDFPTGIMRARLDPRSGDLFACGMFGWGSNQSESAGGLYRVRPTGEPMHLPVALRTHSHGVTIRFTEPLDQKSASNPGSFLIEAWDLKRSANYGSQEHNRREMEVESAVLSADGESVTLTVTDIEPTWCMEIAYELSTAEGGEFQGVIQNSIYQLGDPTPAVP